jgi:hypothetical protein
MRGCLPKMNRGRATIAVVALYALLLQAFLGYAAPVRALGSLETILCADHPAGGDPAEKAAGIHIHACCTAVQAGTGLVPRSDPAVAAAPVAAHRVAWRPEADLPRTGPPPRNGTARGPPAG